MELKVPKSWFDCAPCAANSLMFLFFPVRRRAFYSCQFMSVTFSQSWSSLSPSGSIQSAVWVSNASVTDADQPVHEWRVTLQPLGNKKASTRQPCHDAMQVSEEWTPGKLRVQNS